MDQMDAEQLIAEAFAVFDQSGDGRISPEELAATVNAMHLAPGVSGTLRGYLRTASRSVHWSAADGRPVLA